MDVVTVRKLPVEHEAIQWLGSNVEQVSSLLGDAASIEDQSGERRLMIETLHGWVECAIGDWVVKGERDAWPVDAAQFADTYEIVDAEKPVHGDV